LVFGHEHRCALYRDTATEFSARLIGNGCIPHEVQTEKEADPGCTPVDYFNHRQNGGAFGSCGFDVRKTHVLGTDAAIADRVYRRGF
jgi:hypothetical protein